MNAPRMGYFYGPATFRPTVARKAGLTLAVDLPAVPFIAGPLAVLAWLGF